MPLALAFGNSHIAAYVKGHQLALDRGVIDCDMHAIAFHDERFQPYISLTERGPEYHPAVAEAIRDKIAEVRPDCLVTAVHGSEHWKYGMVRDERPFDFVVPSLPQHALSPDTELIPYDLLNRRFRIDLGWQFALVRSVRTFCDLPIFHIEAPPPVASEELMRNGVNGQTRENMDQYGMPSVSFRYKIWWIWAQVSREWCAELDLLYVEGPPDSRDAQDFLDEKFFVEGLHGTAEYGALMAREVANAMRGQGIAGG